VISPACHLRAVCRRKAHFVQRRNHRWVPSRESETAKNRSFPRATLLYRTDPADRASNEGRKFYACEPRAESGLIELNALVTEPGCRGSMPASCLLIATTSSPSSHTSSAGRPVVGLLGSKDNPINDGFDVTSRVGSKWTSGHLYHFACLE